MISDMVADFIGGARKIAIRNTATAGLRDDDLWNTVAKSRVTASGERVGARDAMRYSPVWRAVLTLADDIACCTLNKYQRQEDKARTIQPDRINRLISRRPNNEYSAWELWHRAVVHACLWSQSYIYIERRNRVGDAVNLINLLPDRTVPERDEFGNLYYKTLIRAPRDSQGFLPEGAQPGDYVWYPLFAREVLHLKRVSIDNDTAINLVEKARDSWGLGIGAETFLSKFLANGASAGGVLTIPPTMSKRSAMKLSEGWFDEKTGQAGLQNAFKVAILRDGAKFHPVTVDPQSSQMSEIRNDQRQAVGDFFKLLPFKMGIEQSFPYRGHEQAQVLHVTGTLNPWFAMIRGECEMKLLTIPEQDRDSHFFDHNFTKLIEPDSKTMEEILEIRRRNKIITGNEWRMKINLPPSDDPDADKLENPNTSSSLAGGNGDDEEDDDSGDNVSVGEDGDVTTENRPNRPNQNELDKTLRDMVADAVTRAVGRLERDLSGRISSRCGPLERWGTGIGIDHHGVITDILRPACGPVAMIVHGNADLADALVASARDTMLLPLAEIAVLHCRETVNSTRKKKVSESIGRIRSGLIEEATNSILEWVPES